jgi:MtrB/PioB family decaheme-associated outer membrane protein
MRRREWLMLAALAALHAPQALAQTTPASQTPASAQSGLAPVVGEIDFGAQITGGLDEVGRFQRFEDRRSGATLQRLRYARNRETWAFTARMDHVGYRDQRYFASFDQYGRVKASFEWTQTPLWASGVSSSPFEQELPGVLRLDDATQSSVQAGTASLADYASTLLRFDTRSRRDVAGAKVRYSLTRNLDLLASFTSTGRSGEQPWGAPFGFSNATEVAAPIDNRTNDLNTTAEWSNRRGMARVAYDGSWFNNAVDTLIWDNPLRFTDQTHGSAYAAGNGSSQGRMPLWPDSTAHTVSAAGSIGLPARTRAFAYVSVGTWLQDADLLPHTINSAIQPIPLPRNTAEAEARVTAMNYRVTSRPTSMLWFSGQFRRYDYDTRTPHFEVDQYVRLDQNVATSATGGSHPFSYTRNFADFDASFTPWRFVALRAGYGVERDDRTFRFLEETTEHVVRASLDSTAFMWGSVRLQYDHATRTGDGFDEQVFGEIGEQIALRQFDISDRTRDRVSALVQLFPWEAVGVNASLSVGQEHRPDSTFGLQDNDLVAATLGLDLVPRENVGVGLSYAYENLSTQQRSRQSNPGAQFNDPTRDWETDMDEDVHTWTAMVDLTEIGGRTSLRAAYDLVRSDARYLYVMPANSTLPPPQQLPPVINEYHHATADLRYALTRQVAVGVGYVLDKYEVKDFARSPETLSTPLIPAFLNLLNQWRPYDVHTGYARLIYRW